MVIHLKGHVTPAGELEFEPPKNLPPGDVNITIEVDEAPNQESLDFTDDEIAELLTFTPRSGAEVVAAGLTGVWADKGITDPVEWVEEQRRKQREQRKWSSQS